MTKDCKMNGKEGKLVSLGRDLKRDWQKYAMLLVPVTLVFIFRYMPMYGLQIAFKDYSLRKGIWGSPSKSRMPTAGITCATMKRRACLR